jgi:hypothetical protein
MPWWVTAVDLNPYPRGVGFLYVISVLVLVVLVLSRIAVAGWREALDSCLLLLPPLAEGKIGDSIPCQVETGGWGIVCV